MRVIRRAVSIAAVAAVVGAGLPAFAQDVPADGTATLTVEQHSTDTMVGSWMLLKPGDEQHAGEGAETTVYGLIPGNYTFFVSTPDGSTARIRLYKNSDPVVLLDRPQATFALAAGDVLRLAVHYTFSRVGTVAVHSDPPGLGFTLTGPNNFIEDGTTPMNYERMPEGQYKAQFHPIEGCAAPAPKSDLLVVGGRVTLDITLSCEMADKIRSRIREVGDSFVTVKIDGSDVTMRDVPQKAWFAPYVFTAAKLGVILGYRDERGNPTGLFGPENNVNVGELAKIAHKVAGINEKEIDADAENPRARGKWFAPFLASAEQRGWTIFADATIDPAREATRAEVLVTLLQALDVPLHWQKGGVFSDVSTRTQYAAAIETAAADEVISGRTDDAGTDTGTFGPGDPINRAEIAKIVTRMMEVYLKVSTDAR